MATAYDDFTTAKIWGIQARTDESGSGVDDFDGEDARLVLAPFTAGVVGLADAFLVAENSGGADMSVEVGSGGAESDVAIVTGTATGQGNYIVRAGDATVAVTISAADLSNPRIDEIYLVVVDDAYDAGNLSLPRIAYRDGTPASSPSAPGPDAAWDAYLLLATINVDTGATSIENADIIDERVIASLQDSMVQTNAIAELAVTAGKLASNAVTTAKILDANVTQGKLAANIVAAFEVNAHTQTSTAAINTSPTAKSTVSITIPASWGSWIATATATGTYNKNGGTVSYFLRVDDDDGQAVSANFTPDGNNIPFAVTRRSATLTSTGSVDVSLVVSTSSGTGTVDDVALTVRAVRLS